MTSRVELPCQKRQEAVADPVARNADVAVGRVRAERLAPPGEIRLQFVPPDVEQRPHDVAAPAAGPRKARWLLLREAGGAGTSRPGRRGYAPWRSCRRSGPSAISARHSYRAWRAATSIDTRPSFASCATSRWRTSKGRPSLAARALQNASSLSLCAPRSPWLTWATPATVNPLRRPHRATGAGARLNRSRPTRRRAPSRRGG